MATLTDSAERRVAVDHRLIGILDVACDGGAKPAAPHQAGGWIGTTPGNVYLENIDEQVVLGARLRLETWDAPAPFAAADWDRSDVIVMHLPSGILGVDEITYGRQGDIYRLPAGRTWHIRLAWRTQAPAAPDELPDASVLVQFWPADPG